MQHRRNEPVAAHADIARTDDEVVSVSIINVGFLVGFDASVLMMPPTQELADGTAQTFFCKSGGGQEEGGMDGFMSR